MAEKIEIHALEMVRGIRDEQAALLRGKSNAEIIEFFTKAGEAVREEARNLKANHLRAQQDG